LNRQANLVLVELQSLPLIAFWTARAWRYSFYCCTFADCCWFYIC